MLKRIKKSGGFSLIELLAVLAILSILMALQVISKVPEGRLPIQSPRSRQTQYSCICMMKKKQGA